MNLGDYVRLYSDGQYNKISSYMDFNKNKLDLTNENYSQWKLATQKIIPSFNENGINYVLIKYIQIPFIKLNDVDILIENENDITDAINILKNKNYYLFRDRYSINKNKITAMSKNSKIQVDIYPKSTWFNMRYAPDNLITSHKISKELFDFETYVPDPTLDAYIIATHSYNHGTISLAEAVYFCKIIKENFIDWRLLTRISTKYYLNHALILYLILTNFYFGDKYQIYFDKIISNFNNNYITKIYSSWIYSQRKNKFPLILPYSLRLLSSLSRLFHKFNSNDVQTYDELLGYSLALIHRNNRKISV